jgi:hypothetical protein
LINGRLDFDLGFTWAHICTNWIIFLDIFDSQNVSSVTKIKTWECDNILSAFRNLKNECCAFHCKYGQTKHRYDSDELRYNRFLICTNNEIVLIISLLSLVLGIVIGAFIIVRALEITFYLCWKRKRLWKKFKKFLSSRKYYWHVRSELSLSHLGEGEIPHIILEFANLENPKSIYFVLVKLIKKFCDLKNPLIEIYI